MRRLLAFMTTLGAGMFAALLAHAVIFAVEHLGFLGTGYLDHRHGSLPEAIVGSLVVFCGVAMLYGLQVVDETRLVGVLELMRSFSKSRAAGTFVAIPCFALTTLMAMESSEHAFHETFGSIPAIGIAIVIAIALGLGFMLRAFARWVADATEHLVVAALIFVRRYKPQLFSVERGAFDFVLVKRNAEFRRIPALRAPPLTLP